MAKDGFVESIKVLSPEDKLVVKAKGNLTPQEFERLKMALEAFLKQEDVLLVDEGYEVYIVKKDAKIELRSAINERIKN